MEDKIVEGDLSGLGGESTIEVILRMDFGLTAGDCASREERVTVYKRDCQFCITDVALEGPDCRILITEFSRRMAYDTVVEIPQLT